MGEEIEDDGEGDDGVDLLWVLGVDGLEFGGGGGDVEEGKDMELLSMHCTDDLRCSETPTPHTHPPRM